MSARPQQDGQPPRRASQLSDVITPYWHRVTESMWFVPLLMVVLAVIAAIVLVELQKPFARYLEGWPRIFAAGAEGARGVLSAIAGSAITVAGVTFSLVIVGLSMAASQYTPRIIRTFMKSRQTQVVLGYFLALFAYCLVVLRIISRENVPSLAIFGALLLALGGTVMLVWFIHHMATSLQASYIIQNVGRDTRRAIDRLYPEDIGAGPDREPHAAHADAVEGTTHWVSVCSETSGYLQNVASERLLAFTLAHDILVRVEPRMGEFVYEGRPLARLPAESATAKQLEQVRHMFKLGRYRTIDQDAAFGISELADIAIKALSPGINDPTTAIACIDHLGALIGRLAQRRIPSEHRYAAGKLRVIARAREFASYVEEAFGRLVPHARDDPQIYLRLLDALGVAAQMTQSRERTQVLIDMGRYIEATARITLRHRGDAARVERSAARMIMQARA